MATENKFQKLTSHCKEYGFIFQSSEIYGGYAGFFDYGPLGSELKKNVKDAWWKAMVHERDDIVGLDSSIIMHPEIWKASGHVEGFNDPMVDCKESKKRYRADQLFFSPVSVDGTRSKASQDSDCQKVSMLFSSIFLLNINGFTCLFCYFHSLRLQKSCDCLIKNIFGLNFRFRNEKDTSKETHQIHNITRSCQKHVRRCFV